MLRAISGYPGDEELVSDVFCGQCGVQASDGNFCRNCGAPLAPQAQPPGYQQPGFQQPVSQQPVSQQPSPQPWVQPTYPAVPAAPMVNPFAGMPLTDIARDVTALVLLFASLAMLWDFGHDAADRWWVVIATIISALSLAVPYLVALSLVPGWGPAQARLVKYVCFVPYGVSVAAALVNDLTHVGDDRDLSKFAYIGAYGKQLEESFRGEEFDLSALFSGSTLEGGIGPAVFVGLAGALLAMQARRSDEEPSGNGDAIWRVVVVALTGLGAAAFAATALIAMATDLGDDISVALILGSTVATLALAAVLALGLVGVLRGGREWARVLAVTGFAVVATQFFGGLSDSFDPLFGSYFEGIGTAIGSFVAVAGTVLLVARPIQRRLASYDPITSWVHTARNASLGAAVALGLAAVSRLLLLIGIDQEGDDAVTGTGITAILLLVVAAVLAGFISTLLAGGASRADQNRRVVLGLTGAIFLLAVVAIAVGRSGEFFGAVTPIEVIGWFALPGVILFALLFPEEIRTSFRPIAGPPAAYQAPAGYQPPPAHPSAPDDQAPPPDDQAPPPGYQAPPS